MLWYISRENLCELCSMPVCACTCMSACPVWHMRHDYFPCRVTFYSHSTCLVLLGPTFLKEIFMCFTLMNQISKSHSTHCSLSELDSAVVDGFGVDGSAIGAGGGLGAQTLTITSSQGRNTAMLSRARAVHEQERNERGHRMRLSSGGVMC